MDLPRSQSPSRQSASRQSPSRQSASTLSAPIGTEPELRAQPRPDGTAPLVLVLGATGYLGGRLVPRLLAGGARVRVLSRSADRIRALPWGDQVELVVGDAGDRAAMQLACADVDTLFHLVHSMSGGSDFAARDRAIALSVSRCAADQGVSRIVYLSGLHPDADDLSQHLASRAEVGEILLASAVPALVLQAGVVIGSGSASFEMVRHLTEVLPVMPAPRWVRNRIQPIAVRDVLHYLLASARLDPPVNEALDIGGPDVLRYDQMMNTYAAVAGLPHRRIIALPVLTPWLASHWVGLVTPVPRNIARPLVASLQHPCVMRDHRVDDLIPPPADGLTPYRTAVELALGRIALDEVETSWVDTSVARAPSDPLPSDPEWAGRTVFTDVRHQRTTAYPAEIWAVLAQIGGGTGWYSGSLLWALRGWFDRLTGGVGVQRGRRNRGHLAVGDAVDVWRVEAAEPERLLRLRAEMRVPGTAWLEFRITETARTPDASKPDHEHGHEHEHELWQRAVFFPRGLSGRLYWLAMLPFHGFIFSGMQQRMIALAERNSTAHHTKGGA